MRHAAGADAAAQPMASVDRGRADEGRCVVRDAQHGRGLDARSATVVDGLLGVAETLAGEPDDDRRFQSLCDTARSVIGCDRSSLFLGDGDRFKGSYNAGNPPEIARQFPRFSISLRDPLLAEAIRRRSYVIVNDAHNDPLMNAATARVANIRALVMAPLFNAAGEPAGCMTVEYNQTPGRFGELESKLLLGLAKLAETVLAAREQAIAREQLATQLQAAARLDALSRLSSGIAHDLNNRLTVILGVGDLLRQRYPDPDIETLELAATASAELTRRLLQFARGEPGNAPGATNASDVLPSLEYTLRRFTGPLCELRLDVGRGCAVACSRSQFEQIVTNLVINAVDAMPDGGAVHVSLRRTDADERGAPGVLLQVADEGAGISAGVLPHVFEPFFSTKSAAAGTGLGLASVHGIVTSVGGRIDVDSSPGKGARFDVHLPLAADVPVEHDAPAPVAPSATGPVGVLVVDDDEPVRRFIATALERDGHRVIEAAEAKQALRLARERAAEIDVLVCDLMMPEIDGMELASTLRELRPTLPVLFVSAYFPRHQHRDLPGTGKTAFLAKPFAPSELARRLAEVIGTMEQRAGED